MATTERDVMERLVATRMERQQQRLLHSDRKPLDQEDCAWLQGSLATQRPTR